MCPESDDDFDENVKMDRAQNPRVHQNTCLMNDQIDTSTCTLSESKLDNNVDEFRVQYPVEHHKEKVQEAKTESNREYTSVFSLSSKSLDISFMENVDCVVNEKITDCLMICKEDIVLQSCKINSELLDSTDKGIFLIGIIGEKPYTNHDRYWCELFRYV